MSLEGVAFELDQGYLAGQIVTVAQCFVVPGERPWVEHEGKRLALHPVDPQRNARRKRPPSGEPAAVKPVRPSGFSPLRALTRDNADDDTSGGGP